VREIINRRARSWIDRADFEALSDFYGLQEGLQNDDAPAFRNCHSAKSILPGTYQTQRPCPANFLIVPPSS
jgi:hypothetical protein